MKQIFDIAAAAAAATFFIQHKGPENGVGRVGTVGGAGGEKSAIEFHATLHE